VSNWGSSGGSNGAPATIISCAVTGGADNAHMNPAIPVTPGQIAAEALAARTAGAAVVHIHVRDPATGKPSRKLELYREVVARIRDSGSDVVINLTTGPGARLQPDDAGVKPELEVFDLGHVALARRMVEQGHFAAPPFLQLCMGVPWGAPATPEAVLAMRAGLPAGALWSAFGISRHQFPTVALAAVLGGHVRVGLEDNLYLSRGVLAPGNAALVERAAALVRGIGAEVATPAEARALLGIEQD